MLEGMDASWLRTLTAPHGSLSRGVIYRVLAFGTIAAIIELVNLRGAHIGVSIGYHEIAGAVIALALAFRTNTGYARFWEGRTLWGAIVNACRNLARTVQIHGRPSADEMRKFATWIAVFAHTTRRSLREQTQDEEIAALLTGDELAALRKEPHQPIAAAMELSRQLREIAHKYEMNPFMVVQAETLIANLVDYLGGCERIRRTPTPFGFVMLVRRCIVFFLASLPLAVVDALGWSTVIITMAVAYPVLMIEAIAIELDNPFGHDANDLPLSRICATIEKNLLGTDMPPSNAPAYLQD